MTMTLPGPLHSFNNSRILYVSFVFVMTVVGYGDGWCQIDQTDERCQVKSGQHTVLIVIITLMMMMASQQIPTSHIPTRWEYDIMIKGGNMTQSHSHQDTY